MTDLGGQPRDRLVSACADGGGLGGVRPRTGGVRLRVGRGLPAVVSVSNDLHGHALVSLRVQRSAVAAISPAPPPPCSRVAWPAVPAELPLMLMALTVWVVPWVMVVAVAVPA